jgi:hypothetical protein
MRLKSSGYPHPSLQNHRDQIPAQQETATIHTAVPVLFEARLAGGQEPDAASLREVSAR